MCQMRYVGLELHKQVEIIPPVQDICASGTCTQAHQRKFIKFNFAVFLEFYKSNTFWDFEQGSILPIITKKQIIGL